MFFRIAVVVTLIQETQVRSTNAQKFVNMIIHPPSFSMRCSNENSFMNPIKTIFTSLRVLIFDEILPYLYIHYIHPFPLSPQKTTVLVFNGSLPIYPAIHMTLMSDCDSSVSTIICTALRMQISACLHSSSVRTRHWLFLGSYSIVLIFKYLSQCILRILQSQVCIYAANV